VATGALLLTTAGACVLAYGSATTGRGGGHSLNDYVRQFVKEMHDPWVWFGLGAQGLFFMRFFYQWLVSEKLGRSTIPVAFWYFSMAGALSTFVYAAGRLDPAIMCGQLPACFFYIRNLMLIRSRADRLRQAGLPVPAGAPLEEDDLPD
jgi:lipid-A-disaccharide synthase-like uncharacterized protein